MRIGILGGSFDPPHVGHLLAASDAIDELQLDRLILVPAAVQPLKPDGPRATGAQRLAMLRAMVADDGRFEVDPVELDRAGLSYTVDTLASFAARHADAERYFLIGADALAGFAKWKEPDRIASLARIAVLARGDEALPPLPPGAVALRTRRVDVSSTEIRERVRTGRSIRGFVPDAVAAHIEAERLYR